MHHATPLITTIVGGLVLAFILGMLANKLRISPLVGYLLAGVLAGPFTPGFVADTKLAPELAELGVILLMFGVGLHFSLKDLMAVKAIAIPGAIAQIAVATLLGMALSAVLGWSLMTGIVFGLCLSTASTDRVNSSREPVAALRAIIHGTRRRPTSIIMAINAITLPMVIPISTARVAKPTSPCSIIPATAGSNTSVRTITRSSTINQPMAICPR